MADKLDLESKDLIAEKLEQLQSLFPNLVTEGENGKVLDLDQLKNEFSTEVVEGTKERYRLEWPGKKEAIVTANLPTTKTLRPVKEDSVDWDTTENLYIEGDNLEVLKILQESYFGKIKMIYIDPPYNTGQDFVYKDNFSKDAKEELEESGQKDEYNQRLFQNADSSGRYHSNWLSMIYPRLKLARNMLREDGVVFASIDDAESANLKRIFDEVFGEKNFIDTIAVEMSTTSGPKTVNAQQGTIVKNVEFVHVYRKSDEFDKKSQTPLLDGINTYDTHYSLWLNDDGTLGTLAEKIMSDAELGSEIRKFGLVKNGKFSIKSIDKLISLSKAAKLFIDNNLDKIARIDRPPVSAMKESTEVGKWAEFDVEHRKYLLTTLSNGNLQALMPLSLNYRMSDDYKARFGRTVIRGDLWKGFHQDMGNVAKEGDIKFANGKKPIRLISQLIKWANGERDGVILDFFSGSATTAHAVMALNSSDGGKRKHIMVQLPEATDEKSEASKAGYRNICEIGKERIRRAAATIKEETGADIDYGFRVYRLDESNMADVYHTPQDYDQDKLELFADNVKEGRTADDLLAQIMLDWGLPLSLPIAEATIAGKRVFHVAGNSLLACFDSEIDEAFAKEVAKKEPLRIVFKDAGFASDTSKSNVKQLLKQLSPETEMKVI